ncbi:VOC family protein [Staphylococcus intermedius]|uniref:VOC family protein n=1 Tax=Staphylococcus intermedius TaxID=1285 RepID=UPI000BBC827A|nr:VOC family protein [Staphylococcus intermedius]PCF84991.1 ring-cleaving dioxygenase [Staphylococcus intermedius]
MEPIKHIHHISAIVGHPKENKDFYEKVLNLRLVKKTVNFDDPGTYHLYFSNDNVDPGTIMTFFPWANAYNGRVGSGQVGRIAFRIPKNSKDYWIQRLNDNNVETTETEPFRRPTIEFEDIHGLDLALVESDEESDTNKILGFHGSVLLSLRPVETLKELVDDLGLTELEHDADYFHFETAGDLKHHIIIPKTPLLEGRWGVGTVHHIAWSVDNDEQHLAWQKYLMSQGYHVTEVKDRNYFKAIYTKERGHIIFEFATIPPGFDRDEPKDQLGQKIMLPPQYENQREELLANLPDLD